MKNKKGFTLIELLVVIALLAVITTSISVATFEMLTDQQDSMDESEIENIENAACAYVEVYSKRSECVIEGANCTYKVTISELISSGYIDGNEIETSYVDEDGNEIENYVIVKWDDTGLKTCVY